ncbi:MAG: GNAT family N-acetyltransferase [Gammaproteobacteria bacterium]|nr:GNAT family N-acetyltransferase [Gammaproteobacteria bacterium]
MSLDAKIEIRQATLEDFDAILQLAQNLTTLETSYDVTVDADWIKNKFGAEYFKEKIVAKDALFLIAICKGEIVGYLAASIIPAQFYRKLSELADLEEIFIVPSYRHSGLGSNLIERCVAWCKEKQIKKLSVTVSANNLQALKFYQAKNFNTYDLILERDIL